MCLLVVLTVITDGGETVAMLLPSLLETEADEQAAVTTAGAAGKGRGSYMTRDREWEL